MRLGATAFLVIFLLTTGVNAERLSHDLEKRFFSSAATPVDQRSDTEQALDLRGSTVTIVEPLPNGGFESGAAIWTEASLNGWNLILESSEFPVGIPPHGGHWGVWLGGDHEEISYVQQQVTIPTGSPVLKYWHWIDSEDDCGYDFGGVIVNSTSVVEQYDLCWQTDTAGWAIYSVDMSAYAGQTLDLQIRIETDDQLISNLYVDDVFFEYQVIPVFTDGFESGDTDSWAAVVP